LALGYRALHDLSRVDHIARLLTAFLPFYSFVNRKNNVTELQRVYQTAYAQHNRIWKIVSQFPPTVSDLIDPLDPPNLAFIARQLGHGVTNLLHYRTPEADGT